MLNTKQKKMHVKIVRVNWMWEWLIGTSKSQVVFVHHEKGLSFATSVTWHIENDLMIMIINQNGLLFVKNIRFDTFDNIFVLYFVLRMIQINI